MYSELVLYKALSGLAIAASILPLLWHVKSKNLPGVCLIMWIGLYNSFSFINAFIWGGDIFTAWEGEVFCDIEIKFMIAAMTGTMGAIAACTRNLADVMRDDLPVVKTRAAKRRQLIADLLLCFGVPVWMMSIHYVIQPDRYWLFEIMGCTPSVDNSWPSIVLVFIWPPIVALVATYFCILVFIRLYRHQAEFQKLLTHSSNNTTKSRFLRLYIYCSSLILFLFPTTFYTFYHELNVERLPYDWNLVHDPAMWASIYRIPTYGHVSFDKWIIIGAGLLLFIFFGVGQDATNMYKGWLIKVGLDKHWDSMAKKKDDQERTQAFASGWSGNGTVSSSGVMISVGLESIGDNYDDDKLAALHMEEGSSTWKGILKESPIQHHPNPPIQSRSPSSITHPHFTNSSSDYSLPGLNLNAARSPLVDSNASALRAKQIRKGSI